jgi:hypothetical protein
MTRGWTRRSLPGLAVPGAQAGFLTLAAAWFVTFLVRRRQVRPWR